MASNNNNHQTEGTADDFLEQILGFPGYAASADPNTNAFASANDAASLAAVANSAPPMMLQLSSAADHFGAFHGAASAGSAGGGFPLGLSLDQGKGGAAGGGFLKLDDASGRGKRFRDDVLDSRATAASSLKPNFHGQPMHTSMPAAPHPPAIRPRVRARRGQATDPHSIAERQRRERIAERIRALQELVPSVNKTDRAAMVDEIVDYVKFLRLQVKVLSMSRLGGAGAVAPLVTDIPISSVEEEDGEGGKAQPAWEKWSNDGTERQVAKLMEENVGAAMQFLQSKALCIMPISLASAICHTQSTDSTPLIKPEMNTPS